MSTLYNIQQEIFSYFFKGEKQLKLLDEQAIKELSIYKSLVLGSMEGLVAKIFSKTHSILNYPEDNWRKLIQDYLHKYPSKSAIYNELAKDFPSFVQELIKDASYPNYLGDLASYEWAELEINNYPDKETPTNKLNPASKFLYLQFPIPEIIEYLNNEEISIEEKRSTDIEKQTTNILVYRDPTSLIVRSFTLNDTSLFVLQELEQDTNIKSLAQKTVSKFSLSQNIDEVQNALETLLIDLKNLKILLD